MSLREKQSDFKRDSETVGQDRTNAVISCPARWRRVNKLWTGSSDDDELITAAAAAADAASLLERTEATAGVEKRTKVGNSSAPSANCFRSTSRRLATSCCHYRHSEHI